MSLGAPKQGCLYRSVLRFWCDAVSVDTTALHRASLAVQQCGRVHRANGNIYLAPGQCRGLSSPEVTTQVLQLPQAAWPPRAAGMVAVPCSLWVAAQWDLVLAICLSVDQGRNLKVRNKAGQALTKEQNNFFLWEDVSDQSFKISSQSSTTVRSLNSSPHAQLDRENASVSLADLIFLMSPHPLGNRENKLCSAENDLANSVCLQ